MNGRGREAAERIGHAISERGWTFDAIVSSPAARTRETIERVGLADQARWEERLYLASTDALLAILQALPEKAHSALIVGHNPGLQDIVLGLGRPDSGGLRKRVLAKFPTAALAIIDLDADSWREVEPGSGIIVELLLAREL